jgi:cation:H+ antiporter
MGTAPALALLALSLAVTLGAARMFAQRLDRLGVAFGLPEALVGLLTALAADGPEISSALIALAKGEHAVGVGVVVGSNAFNLAAMIGLSALLSGAVALHRAALAVEGAMGLAATLLAAAVLLGALAPLLAVVLLLCFGVPYLLALLSGPELAARLPLPATARAALAAALGEHGHEPDPTPTSDPAATADPKPVHPHHALWILSDVALIVAGSFGMVQAAVSLGGRWGVSGALVGVLALGPLTSLPNAMTGVRLGLARRGAALVSETLNSNTINLAGGVLVPALFVTVTSSSTRGHADLAWLLGMTCVCLLSLARPRGAGRGAGALLVLLYCGFVALQLVGI